MTDSFSVELDGLDDGLGLPRRELLPPLRRRGAPTARLHAPRRGGLPGRGLPATTAPRPSTGSRPRRGRRRPAGRARLPRLVVRHRAAADAAASVRKVSVTASASGSGKTTVGARARPPSRRPLRRARRARSRPELDRDARRRAPAPARAGPGGRRLGDRRRLPAQDRPPRVRARRRDRLDRPSPPRLAAPAPAAHGPPAARPRGDLERQPRDPRAASSWGREALIPYAVRMHFSRRKRYPKELASFPVVRLRTQAEVDAFLDRVGPTAGAP